VGLPPSHPQSYAHVIRAEFTDHIDIDSARVHSPDGIAEDIFTAAEHYDASITDAGPVDVQLLGIGATGTSGSTSPARRSGRAHGSRR
jgi:glucosamine-6-phosphate deaminase